MRGLVVYRLCGCEVREFYVAGLFVYVLSCGGTAVAEFTTRNAAIRYLANEFITTEAT